MGWGIDGAVVDFKGGGVVGPDAEVLAVMVGLGYWQRSWGNWWGVYLVWSQTCDLVPLLMLVLLYVLVL